MAIGYDYHCKQCRHDWMLFSTRFTLGPVQWGELKYTCFTCQTFLSIASSVDANSWSIWRRNHESEINGNTKIAELAQSIDDLFVNKRELTPIELHFDSIECPTCHDAMSTAPFGEHLMKCPKCKQFSGEFDNSSGISTYIGPIEGDTEESN